MGKRSKTAKSERRYEHLYKPTGKRGRELRSSGYFAFKPMHEHSLVSNEDIRLYRKIKRQQQKDHSPFGLGILPGWFL